MATGAVTQRAGDAVLYTASRPGMTVYVTYNWFHSDLNVPMAFLAQGRGASAAAVAHLAPRRWVALGWGDAVFYQGDGFSFYRLLALLRSILWPRNASVVHLAAVDDPLSPAPGWRALSLTLSPHGAEALRRRLDASFARQDGLSVLAEAAGAPPAGLPADLFFKSRENAWAFHVCNHWTGELLNAAGVPVTPVADLSTAGLTADLRWRAHAIPAPDPTR